MDSIRWKAVRARPCMLAACLGLLVLPCFAAPEISNGELIIRFRAQANTTEITRATRAARLKIKRHVRTAPMAKQGHPGLTIVTSDLDLHQTLAILRKDPAVQFAEPNLVLHSLAASNDPYFTTGNLWGMYGDLSMPANQYGSQAAEAWAAGYVGSNSVYVAVIDDGMQITHPELAPNVWSNPFDPPDGIDNDGNGFVDDVNGWNFAAGNNSVFQGGDNHGTHVAGIIGARGGNGTGVAGVNWNVTLIPVKFIASGSGNTDDAVQAIDYCVDLKTRHGLNLVAINASWGGSGYSAALHEAIIRAAKAGILFVVAAGNSGGNNDASDAIPSNLDTSFGTLSESPAGYNSVISVAAIDSAGARASFSSYGATRVHIGAPGVSIFSTYPTNIIGGLSGTSMATPHVTGAVALYASTHPTATASQIRAAILGAAIPTASLSGKVSTGGRLNLSDIIVPAPSLAGAGALLVSETWLNGVIDPGETVTVQLGLTNLAPFGTANLTGTLLPNGGVLNPSGPQNFGALSAGGNVVSRNFSFSAEGTCGQNITLTLSLKDGVTNLGAVTFSLPLGVGTNVFAENFDSLAVPALPTGWSASLSGAGTVWKTAAGISSSGANAIYAPDPNGVSDNALTSPVIHIHSGSATLSFRQSFSLEPGWDGGVLEISIAGGPYADVLAAGGTFLQNGYNLLLDSSTTPLASRLAWSGNSGGFISTAVQLPSACVNQNVQLRWRCGSDTSLGGNGWYVDSISLIDGYVCALDPAMDLDGDGLSNFQELLAGTDPSDPRSVLRIVSAENINSASGVQFSSVLGKSYVIEENSNFPAASWQPIGAQSGTGSLITQSDSGGTDVRRLYRVTTTGENGASVSSEYSGHCRLTLLGNSDTVVSVPFTRPPAEFGAVQTVTGNVLQLRGAPGWAINQWVYNAPSQSNTYYLLVRSGALEGEYFTISANSSDSLTLDLQGASLSPLATGDAVAIVPYWTLGTVFPSGNGVHQSLTPGSRSSEILFPNIQGIGVNLSAATTYYFCGGNWRRVGQGLTIKNDDVILPDMYLVARHNVAGDTTLTTQGAMLAGKSHILVRRQTNGNQDNSIALVRPMAVTLDNSGLIQGGAFRASSFPGSPIDQLLVFDNSTVGKNKSAAGAYYYWNGAWTKVGGAGANVGADPVFTPGAGVILRSGAASSAAIWEVVSPY